MALVKGFLPDLMERAPKGLRNLFKSLDLSAINDMKDLTKHYHFMDQLLAFTGPVETTVEYIKAEQGVLKGFSDAWANWLKLESTQKVVHDFEILQREEEALWALLKAALSEKQFKEIEAKWNAQRTLMRAQSDQSR